MAMEWLYPELKKINPKDRLGALHESKDTSFDIVEIIGIGIALVLVVTLTRYSVTELGALGRIGAALWNRDCDTPIGDICGTVLLTSHTSRTSRIY